MIVQKLIRAPKCPRSGLTGGRRAQVCRPRITNRYVSFGTTRCVPSWWPMPSSKQPTPVMASVSRGLQVLAAVERSPEGRELGELSRSLGLNKTTVLRLLRTLVAEGALVRDEDSGRYRSDLRSWVSLLPFLGPCLSLLARARGILQAVAEATGGTAAIILPDETGLGCSSPLYAKPLTAVHVDPAGENPPLHRTAAGKCYLAALPEASLKSYLRRAQPAKGGRAFCRELTAELDRVLECGYGENVGEAARGTYAVAVPLRDPQGSVVGGVALALPLTTGSRANVQEFLPHLRTAAASLEELFTDQTWEQLVVESPRADRPLASPWVGGGPESHHESTRFVRSLSRALRVMAELLRNPQGLSLTQVTAARHLPKVQVYRVLRALVAQGAVWHNAQAHRYRVSPVLWLRFAPVLRAATSVRSGVRQVLSELARDAGATACFVLPDRDRRHSVVYDYELPARPLCWHPEDVPPAPLHTVATGKCYLAAQSRLFLEEYCRAGLPALTPHTITDKARLIEELREVTRRGYAVAREEYFLGAGALAVPVKNTAGEFVAAVTVLPVTAEMTEENIGHCLSLLRLAANRLQPLLAEGSLDPATFSEMPGQAATGEGGIG
jgi:IclR family acetate operon transcriptional repressor